MDEGTVLASVEACEHRMFRRKKPWRIDVTPEELVLLDLSKGERIPASRDKIGVEYVVSATFKRSGLVRLGKRELSVSYDDFLKLRHWSEHSGGDLILPSSHELRTLDTRERKKGRRTGLAMIVTGAVWSVVGLSAHMSFGESWFEEARRLAQTTRWAALGLLLLWGFTVVGGPILFVSGVSALVRGEKPRWD